MIFEGKIAIIQIFIVILLSHAGMAEGLGRPSGISHRGHTEFLQAELVVETASHPYGS